MLQDILHYLKDQMTTNQFFSGAAVATVLGTVLYQLKSVPLSIWKRIRRKLIYNVRIYQTSEIYDAFEYYLYNNHSKKYRDVEAFLSGEKNNGNEYYRNSNEPNSNSKKKRDVFFHHFEDRFLIWYGNMPILINKGRDKLENASDLRNAFLSSFTLSTFFNKKVINDLIKTTYEEYEKTKEENKEIYVYTNSYDFWNKTKSLNKSLDDIILPDDYKNKIVHDLDEFLKGYEKYKKLNIPYKRGYLFYGQPGNGKTSLGSAIAGYLNRNVCYLNLSTILTDNDLQLLFKNLLDDSILVIEDIDASFDGRKPIGKVTMSNLLNCLDGVFYKEGLITIVTTNSIEKLDPALIRPGRIDMQLQLKNPPKEQVEKYLSLYYDDKIKLDKYTPNRSMSDITNICLTNNKKNCLSLLNEKK